MIFDASLVVLAGGRGDRLKAYKPLLRVGGKYLIELVLKNLASFFKEVIVVVREEWQKNLLVESIKTIYRDLNISYAIDVLSIEGPLAAMYTGALKSRELRIAVVPSDTPFLTHRAFLKMNLALSEGCEAVVPMWPGGFVEPTIAFYLREPLLRAIDRSISMGEKSARSILKYLNVTYVSAYALSQNPVKEFLNVNTYKDLIIAEDLAKEESLSSLKASNA
ncbi:MAG: molybdenum cofactor guanylyltransferase [Desulfurococcaceae archaeon]